MSTTGQPRIYLPMNDEQLASWMRAMPPAFREWLREQREEQVRFLCVGQDILFVCRAQGRIAILDQFLKFREEA